MHRRYYVIGLILLGHLLSIAQLSLAAPKAGIWMGRTDQDGFVSFIVADDDIALTTFEIELAVECANGGILTADSVTEGRIEVIADVFAVEVENEATYKGRFTSTTAANGTWTYSKPHPVGGICSGSGTWEATAGGYWLELDGDNDYAQAPHSDSLSAGDEPSESLTIEAWIYPRRWPRAQISRAYASIAGKPGSYTLALRYDPDDPQNPHGFVFITGNRGFQVSSSDFKTGEWYHLAGVFDNSNNTITLYINGEEHVDDEPFTDSLPNSTSDFLVGKPTMEKFEYFQGRVEELRISSSSRYHSSFSLPTERFSDDTETRALWHFDEPKGSTLLADSSANSNTLTYISNGDSVPPVTRDDYEDKWHREDFTIALSGYDIGSGIASINYRVNDGEVQSVSEHGHPRIDTEDGSNKIEYWGVDNASNEEEHYILTGIKLDKTGPVLSDWTKEPESLTQLYQGTFRVRVKAADNLSGVSSGPLFDYHIGTSTDYSGYRTMTSDEGGMWYFDITSDWDEHAGEELYYKVKASDAAGNESTSMERTELVRVVTISILMPTANQALPAGTTSATLNVSITNYQGPWHWKLGEPFPATGPAGGNRVESGNTVTIMGLQSGQNYTVYVTFADAEGNVLNPSMTVSVTFSVEALPEFVISVVEPEASAALGDHVIYSIKLEGKSGFTGVVKLSSKGLPADVEALFNPDEAALSAETPSLNAQLMLKIGTEAMTGDYSFTVLVISESGVETKELRLTLRIEKAATEARIDLGSPEVSGCGELSVSGQLSSISEAPMELRDLAVHITFIAPNGNIYPFEIRTDAVGKYQLPKPFSPNTVGEWKIRVYFEGDERQKPSELEAFFTVEKIPMEIVLNIGEEPRIGIETTMLGQLEPLCGESQLEGELLSLKILRPNKSTQVINVTAQAAGAFQHKLKLDMDGDWEITAAWPGNDQYESAEQTLEFFVPTEYGKAILVLGGGNQRDNTEWTRFNILAGYVHDIFLKRHFDDEEDIYFLSPDPGETKGADHPTSVDELRLAITNWAAERVNEYVPLYLYLLSHNLGNQFLLEKHGNDEMYITPTQLDSWLDKLPENTPVTIIIEACHSGNFIRTADGRPTALVDSNRIIIASARGDREAAILENGLSFSKILFERIRENDTIGEALRFTEDKMERLRPFHYQFPQVDADGDGQANTPQDYAKIARRYLPADIESLTHPPQIIAITPPQALPEGTHSLRIYAELLGVDITCVFAIVIPPDFDPAQPISDWSALDFPQFDLAMISGKENKYQYAATYNDFTIPGDYAVIVNAENLSGSATPMQTTITVGGIKGDVNKDGSIRSNDAILALRIAAGLMEPTEYQRQVADINGDGRIKSNDAILILRKAAGL